MIRLLPVLLLLLPTACKYRNADAVADYPDVYLCKLNDGYEKTENASERKAVADEVARRGIECYEGVVKKTDSILYR